MKKYILITLFLAPNLEATCFHASNDLTENAQNIHLISDNLVGSGYSKITYYRRDNQNKTRDLLRWEYQNLYCRKRWRLKIYIAAALKRVILNGTFLQHLKQAGFNHHVYTKE